MAVGYILITCELGKAETIAENLKKVDGVIFVDEVLGAYDLLVKVESSNLVELGETISWKIKNIKDIRSTMTLNRKE